MVWLFNFKNPQCKSARWPEELGQYDMDVRHRPGYKHINADALSKMPDIDWCEYYRLGQSVENLPCRGCQYCQRMHKKWSKFKPTVDDTTHLATFNDDSASAACQISKDVYRGD